MKRAIVGLLLAAAACGRDSGPSRMSSLQLVVPAGAIEMQGGETRQIQLLVLGVYNDQVTLSGQLPTFASISGSMLTLAPTRADAGDYPMTVTATASGDSTSAELRVIVSVPNTPPNWI